MLTLPGDHLWSSLNSRHFACCFQVRPGSALDVNLGSVWSSIGHMEGSRMQQ